MVGVLGRGRSTGSAQVRRMLATALAAVVIGAPIAAALAEVSPDYTVTTPTGLYEAPPPSAVAVTSSATSTTSVLLPFEFPYFGVLYDRVRVSIGGYIAFGNDNTGAVVSAQDPSRVQSGAPADGACAPLWAGFSTMALPRTFRWTAGEAPNRRFVVSYEDVRLYSGATGAVTVQVKLHEGTGRIEFAYKPDTTPSTWTNLQYSIGLVAPGPDPRWVAPVNTSTTNSGRPATDFRFDPVPVVWSGTLLYERLTPTTSGLGTVATAAPMSGLALDAYDSLGAALARGRIAADGTFRITAFRARPATTVTLLASARSPGVAVLDGLGAPHARACVTGLDPAVSTDVGSLTVDVGADPSAAFRGPAHVASVLTRAASWLSTRATTPLPDVAVTLDMASGAASAYTTQPGSPPAALRVAGPQAANPDLWDDGVLLVAYGRYVAAALAAPPGTAIDDRADVVTTPPNGFAVGCGHALFAAVTGQTTWIDTSSSGAASFLDLESPSLTSARGPSVAGWVGAALFDLLDADNEHHDRADGTVDGGDRIVAALERLTSAPDAGGFAEAWNAQGFDTRALSRVFIAHGLLADDVFEPNDDADESAPGIATGERLDGLVLNVGNEDWFDLVLAAPVADLVADVGANRVRYPATLELELSDAAGQRIGQRLDSGLGPVSLATGPLAAGAYRLRVAHVSGLALPAYSLQAGERLRLGLTPLRDWTVGRPYAQPLPLTGGIGARRLAVETGTAPPGLVFDAVGQQVSGTPATAGRYEFQLVARDAGSPEHAVAVSHSVVIHDVLSLQPGPFLPFALGSPNDLRRPHLGGTPPLAVELTSGALPSGLTMFADAPRFHGTPTTAGSLPLSLRATDVAGSVSEAATTAVVCVRLAEPGTAVALAPGPSACGYFVDAVQGSRIAVAVAPRPKGPKRALGAVMLDAHGEPLEGAAVRLPARASKASVTLAAAPVTGRYFVVLHGDDGDAAELLASASVAAPRSGKGRLKDVASGDRVTIEFGALAGARVRLAAKAEKAAGQSLTALSLVGPDGVPLALSEIAESKGAKLAIDAVLPVSGTWRLLVRASGDRPGDITYKLRLTQPRGVTFTQD